MAESTGIAWTDSTSNPWWGCTKVAEATACADCYAELVDRRTGQNHWGHGAPRRRTSAHARNEPFRWQKKADKFFAEHGRDRRVFTLSMGDLFDNEVPSEWRDEHFATMEACGRLRWQICTKRITNLPKMVPAAWCEQIGGKWPSNIGVLITVVTQAEADRDIPRLLECKKTFGIPWVGISYEPAQEQILLDHWMGSGGLDWVIFGGKSGPKWNDRPFNVEWGREALLACAVGNCAFFFKQVAAFRPTDAMIPADLLVRQFPEALS